MKRIIAALLFLAAPIAIGASLTIPVCDGYTIANGTLVCPSGSGAPPAVTPPPVVSACTRNMVQNWTSNYPVQMGPNDTVAIKFTTGQKASNQTGKIVAFSGSGQDSAHDITVSTTPCDFSSNFLPQLKFTIGTKVGTIPMLALNTTYYLNIRNSVGAVCLSGAFSCDMFVSFYKPAGL